MNTGFAIALLPVLVIVGIAGFWMVCQRYGGGQR